MPDDGDEIALSSGLHLQDGEPVLGIVVGDALDSARKRFERRCCLRSGRSEGHGSERIVLSIDLRRQPYHGTLSVPADVQDSDF